MHVAWKGGDVVRFPGGGHKVNMLRPVVDQWKEEENVVVMFVDRYVQGGPLIGETCRVTVGAAMTWSSLWGQRTFCRSSGTLTADLSFLLSHFAGQMCR